MTILKRLRRIAQAQYQAWSRSGQSPEEVLQSHIDELDRDVTSVQAALAEYAAVFKRSEQDQRQQSARAAEAMAQAEVALRAGDEAQARRALSQKAVCEQRLQRLEADVLSGREIFSGLQRQLRTATNRRDEARRRLSELQARGRAAEAQRTIGRAVNRSREADTDAQGFRQMEHDVLTVEAALEIEQDIRGGPWSDEALARGEQEQQVALELDRLRHKIAAESVPDTGRKPCDEP